MLQPGGLHPMFFHALFISPSALSESPTLGQGDTCRKDQRSVSYSYKKPWNPQEFWEHGTLGGTWRNTKMNEFAPCPPRVRIHPDNSCWSAAVSELPSRASLTSLSLTLGPGNYPLFLDWWWPCQKAACYTEDMSTSALSCLMQEEKEVVRKDRREFAGCSEVQTRHSHWREPAQAMQPKKKKNPEACVSPDCSHLRNREAQPHHLLLKSNSDAQHQESSFYGTKAQPLHVWSGRLVGKVAYAISEIRHF